MDKDAGVFYCLFMVGLGGAGAVYCGLSDVRRLMREEEGMTRGRAIKHVFYENGFKRLYRNLVEGYENYVKRDEEIKRRKVEGP